MTRASHGGLLGLALIATIATGRSDDDWYDQVDRALTFDAGSSLRARASGTVDLEAYSFQTPAPGLLDADGTGLFAPRLTMFLDAQAGAAIYGFAQLRVDRGFDPAADPLRGRVDEYAIRVTPWADNRVSAQIGKFATVVGNWVPRHGSWENAFITAPLPYENLTGVWDSVAAPSVKALLGWAHVRPAGADKVDEKYLRLPVIWGPGYATGASVAGVLGAWDYALELKNASLSSRPEAWDLTSGRWQPTVSGRIGWRPDARWNLGFSASDGPYLRSEAVATLAPGRALRDYRETVFGPDIGFAWHHVELWSELFFARFAMPGIGTVATRAGYIEAKIKLTPRFFAAVRWNEQEFSTVTDSDGAHLPWGHDLWRLDLAPGYRFTPQVQLKLQYSLQHERIAPRTLSQLFATQLTVRF